MREPLPSSYLESLRRFSTPTICNAIETFGLRPRTEGFMDSSITCRFPELQPVAGYAVTARIRASEPPAGREVRYRELWAEMEKVPRPWVVVVEDLDAPHPIGSFWGEVNASVYQALGAIAAVTNGGVRDLPEVRAIGFQLFSACVLVSHAYVHVVEAGVPVTVGGLTVRPGDLLHGDQHGVTSIPWEAVRELKARAEAIEAAERRLIDYTRSPECTVEGLARRYPEVD